MRIADDGAENRILILSLCQLVSVFRQKEDGLWLLCLPLPTLEK